MRKPDDDARKSQARRLLKGKHKDDTNLVTLANKVVDGADAYRKLKEQTLKAKKKKPMIKRELDPKEGVSFSHRASGQYSHPAVIEVRAHRGNDVIGHAHIRTDEDNLESFDTTVASDHRRKGVASGMYHYAEKLTGKKMRPGAGQTKAGEALWADKKRSFGKGIKKQQAVDGGPIVAACAWCKQTKSPEGKWQAKKPPAGSRITHGICPSCESKHLSPHGDMSKWEWGGGQSIVDRVLISPKGEIHQPERGEEHSEALLRLSGKRKGNSHKDGWIEVGRAGYPTVLGHPDVLNNPNHPATRSLANHIARKWKGDIDTAKVWHIPDTKGGDWFDVPRRHAERAVFKQPSQTQLFRSEMIKSDGHYFHSPEDSQRHDEIKNEVQSLYRKWQGHSDYDHEPYKQDRQKVNVLLEEQRNLRKKPWEMSEEEFHSANHTDFLHHHVANVQRGEPEERMLDVQRANGGGVMSYAVEHTGDLIHRMAERTARNGGGHEYVRNKVDNVLDLLKQPYGFMREHNENLKSAASYRKKDFGQHKLGVDQALKEYADAHRKVPVFNEAQSLARSATISIGEKDVPQAIQHLTRLKGYLDEGRDSWEKRARKLDRQMVMDHASKIDKIEKARAFITFPGMGVPKRHYTVGYRDPKYTDAAIDRVANRKTPRTETRGVVAGRSKQNFRTPYPERALTGGLTPKHNPDLGTQRHEEQHGIFHSVGEEHGFNARIAASERLISSIPKEHRAVFHAVADMAPSVRGAHPSIANEERVAFLHSYLNSPNFRNEVHGYWQKQGVDPRRIDQTMKRVHSHIRQVAASMRPEHLRNIKPLKKAQDMHGGELEDLAGNKQKINRNGTIDLYHHTSKENAHAIAQGGFKATRQNSVHFSNKAHGERTEDYGDHAVHVRIHPNKVAMHDAFRDGEIHYEVNHKSIGPNHIVGVKPHPRLKKSDLKKDIVTTPKVAEAKRTRKKVERRLYGSKAIKNGPMQNLSFGKSEGEHTHLVHYSDGPRKEIHPRFHGTGVSGNERKRKDHPDWVDRSYHYDKGSKPEASIEGKRFKHHSSVPSNKIYDLHKDPKGFRNNPVDKQGFKSVNVVERRVKDAGYAGFRHSGGSMPNVVALFHPVKPHTIEDQHDKKASMDLIKKERYDERNSYSIISGEQPRSKVTAKRPLEHHLKDAGYKHHPLKGKYGGKKETSYIVYNADPKHIEHLGRKYGQESVIHSNKGQHKLVHTTGEHAGKHYKGSGITFHKKPPKDNHSTSPDGKTHFTLNFDWSKMHKSEGCDLGGISKNDPVQKEIKWRGLTIAIEWPKGSIRQYGKMYRRKMRCHYGYFKGVMGDDGEELDCYVGDCLADSRIFLISQLKRKDGRYDEEKVMVGFKNAKEAVDVYSFHMDDKQFGDIKEITLKDLKKRLSKRVLAEYDPKGDDVKKGLKSTIAALGTAAALSLPGTASAPVQGGRAEIKAPVQSQVEKPVEVRSEAYTSAPENHSGFLRTISHLESSGGRNLNHRAIESGLHAGTKAMGRYGLMPKTVQDIGRWSSDPDVKKLHNMSVKQIPGHLRQNPQLEHKIAHEYANRLHTRFNGDKARMAHAWFNGPNTGVSSEEAREHPYVKKFFRAHGVQVAQKSEVEGIKEKAKRLAKLLRE